MKTSSAKMPVILTKQACMMTHLEANSISAPAIFQSIGNGDVSQIAQSYVQQSSTEVIRNIVVTLSTDYSIVCDNRVANRNAFLHISKLIEASLHTDRNKGACNNNSNCYYKEYVFVNIN